MLFVFSHLRFGEVDLVHRVDDLMHYLVSRRFYAEYAEHPIRIALLLYIIVRYLLTYVRFDVAVRSVVRR